MSVTAQPTDVHSSASHSGVTIPPLISSPTAPNNSGASNNNGDTTTSMSPPMPASSGAPAAPVSQAQFLLALGQFGVSSVAMMLGNKAAVGALPLPCTLVIIQAVGTLILLGFCRNSVTSIKLDTAKVWLPIATLFTTMLFTSLKSFVYANVSTVIVFRNVGAIVTTIAEYFVRGTVVNTKIVLSELLIVLGAVMYAGGTVDFTWNGLFWIMFNVLAQVAYGVYLKRAMDTEPAVKEMSKYTMSLYNNALALPMTLVVLLLQGEHEVASAKLTSTTAFGWFLIAATCVFGFMISTSGFGLQKLVSATTFLVINNLTKFLNILLGMLFMSDRLVGLADTAGCLVAILAGCWYSWETMQLAEKQKKASAAAKQ